MARYLDGRILKGQTADFLPTKPVFHVIPTPQTGTSIQIVEVRIRDLKAIFFVKDLKGNPAYNEGKSFTDDREPQGRNVRVVFNDGEVLVGTTIGYQPDRIGFFLVPVDPKSNNDRCFVVLAAVESVTFV